MSNRDPKRPITVELEDGTELRLVGNQALTTRLLLANPKGFTKGEANPPGCVFDWSDAIRSLRKKGVPIETLPEKTAGGARIGRFHLNGPVKVVKGGDDDDA